MHARVVASLFVFLSTLVIARPASALDDLAASERIGARIGYIATFDGVDQYYGPGWDVTLYFNERIYSRLYLDIHVGAIYFGDILDPELDDFITRTDGARTEMRSFYFSVGVAYGIPIGGPYALTTSLAAGVYSASVAFASEFTADDFSEQYFGGNASLGIMRRVGTSWSLEANCSVHYFDNKASNTDLFWVFTGGTAEDPLIAGLAFGVVVDLR